MCAIALKNIEIMKREKIVENVRDNGDAFRDTLAQLLDLDIVGDLRGTGFFYALELVKDKETKAGFSDEDCETLLRGFLSPRLFERGLICRADDRGDPVIQISPPLIATQAEFDEMTGILGDVLTEAQERMHIKSPALAGDGDARAGHADSVRVLVVGTGGVGSAVAPIAARRDFFERIVFSDLDPARPQALVDRLGDDRFGAAQLDASDAAAIAELARVEKCDAILNAADPRFNPPIFQAAFDAGCTYLDMAMTLSDREGTKLGDLQFAQEAEWRERGLLALVGIGVEPGLSDVFARYAADHLFSEIDEVGVRDGADLVVDGYTFAPTFSIWTTIEECLNPPVIWERDRGWYTTEPFSEPEVFEFPEGIGPIECVNVEHEEVLLVPRWIDCNRVTFKYGLGEEFIDVLKTLHKLNLDSTEPVTVRGMQVAPRDVVAAALPDPATLGDKMHGRTCAGTYVTGKGKDGQPRATYLYHVVSNEETMARDGAQAVVWQTAINPVVALELLASGTWSGTGVLGPEAFDAVPFLDLLGDYGSPHGVDERTP